LHGVRMEIQSIHLLHYVRLTRVVWSTFARRGKSFTPSAKILIDESSSCILLRRDATQPSSGDAIVVNLPK
jgi:hypothetical protein